VWWLDSEQQFCVQQHPPHRHQQQLQQGSKQGMRGAQGLLNGAAVVFSAAGINDTFRV
jgi:hypothetical protein